MKSGTQSPKSDIVSEVQFPKTHKIFVQQYPKYGYEVRTEVSYPDNADPIDINSAYTSSGKYIGDPQTAKFLCEIEGIAPETIDSEHKVCSIGFCETEQKWYGWSHRAIFGFGIGSSVKKGDCGYIPSSVEELAKMYADEGGAETVDDETVRVAIEMYKVEDGDAKETVELSDRTDENWEWCTIKTGRGEWTAKTLDDARQMAIDFANGVA